MRGLFITLEGIEGVGKSTCIQFLSNYLKQHNIPYIVTREPGGTPLAEEIRDLLLHRELSEPVHSDTELLLLFAARVQHLSQVILPALKSGKWVLCDRFTDASYAYQGGGRRIDADRIEILENLVQGKFRPDLVFLLDAPARKAMQRTRHRKKYDRVEQEKLSFFKRVRKSYLERAEKNSRRYRIVDASKSLPVVKQALTEIMDGFIKSKKKHEAR